ncbi:unnamed protein product, partial [Oikopleura dioica]
YGASGVFPRGSTPPTLAMARLAPAGSARI